MALKVHPLSRLLELEDTSSSAVPYLGYIEVNLQIPGIKCYNENVLLLVILTMAYSEKVPVMVRFKIIDRAMGMMKKGELARATTTWKQAHFSVVMSRSLQLPCTDSRGNGEVGREVTPSPGSDPTAPREFCWMMFNDMSVPHRGSLFPCLGSLAYMAAQASGDIVCGSTCMLNQHKATSCTP